MIQLEIGKGNEEQLTNLACFSSKPDELAGAGGPMVLVSSWPGFSIISSKPKRSLHIACEQRMLGRQSLTYGDFEIILGII